jgi:hypothetical protein
MAPAARSSARSDDGQVDLRHAVEIAAQREASKHDWPVRRRSRPPPSGAPLGRAGPERAGRTCRRVHLPCADCVLPGSRAAGTVRRTPGRATTVTSASTGTPLIAELERSVPAPPDRSPAADGRARRWRSRSTVGRHLLADLAAGLRPEPSPGFSRGHRATQFRHPPRCGGFDPTPQADDNNYMYV